MHIQPANCRSGTLSCGIVAGLDGWRATQRWHSICSGLFTSVRWWCTHSYASPPCQGIHCGAMLATNTPGYVLLTKHRWVPFYGSFHLYMPRKLKSVLSLLWALRSRLLDQLIHFLYCPIQKLFFGHFDHIQCPAHVQKCHLYLTSLPCHRWRHVEKLPEISCFWV